MQLTVHIDDDKCSECDPWHRRQSSAHKFNYIFNLFCTLFVIILQAVLLWHGLQKYKSIHREKATKFDQLIAEGEQTQPKWNSKRNAIGWRWEINSLHVVLFF